MAEYPRVGDLEIDQDLDYEKRASTVRRISWALMVLTVLAALAGLLGRSGPLNRTQAGEAGDPVRVEHERFARLQTETSVAIHVSPPAGATEARVWIDRQYLDGMQIDGMVPEPDRVETGADRLVLVFPLAADGAGPGGFQLDLHLQPQRVGSSTGRVGLEGGPALDFHQFVYP